MLKSMSRDEVKSKIMTDDEYVVGALTAIHSRQTIEEQSSGETLKQNNVGFNSADARILSDFVAHYNRRGFLSAKQIAVARRRLVKYSGQLLDCTVVPKPVSRDNASPTYGGKTEVVKGKPNDGNTARARLGKTGKFIYVRFPYDPAMVSWVKTLEGRRWLPENRRWRVPDIPGNRRALVDKGFDCDFQVLDIGGDSKGDVVAAVNVEQKVTDTMQSTLRPFQMDGVRFFEEARGRALCGDDMGLGKTIQAIAYLAIHPELRPAVVVCPATVKLNWKKEFQKHAGMETYVLDGTMPDVESLGNVDDKIFILNYDILPTRRESKVVGVDPHGEPLVEKLPVAGSGWQDALIHHIRPKIVIFDECHYLKNRKAARTKSAEQIAKRIPQIIGLSGTPITSRPIEFFPMLRMLRPDRFGKFMEYAMKYCGAKHNGFGWDFSGASNLEELHEELKPVMVRRLKRDVLTELPVKIRSIVPVEITNRKLYDHASSEFLAWVQEHAGTEQAARAARAEVLTRFSYLKQLAAQGKMKSAIAWIQDYLESGKKLVVFATHKSVLDKLQDVFGSRSVRVDGSVTGRAREEAVTRFQTDKSVDLFLGNIQAAGVGITLTAADTTVHLEFAWTPGEHRQAEDRVYRIGQVSDSVSAVYLVGENTVDEQIAELLDKKQQTLDLVLDGKTPDEVDEPLLLDLLSMYRDEK